MANLVVDSSVAIKWFIPEPHSTEARKVLNDYQAGRLSFLAPDLINAEFGNIVWKKNTFQGLSAVDAQAIVDKFRELTFKFSSTAELLEEAYKLAVTYHCTVYDALYVAMSVREKCQLVTADEKLVNTIGSAFSNIVLLANWP